MREGDSEVDGRVVCSLVQFLFGVSQVFLGASPERFPLE